MDIEKEINKIIKESWELFLDFKGYFKDEIENIFEIIPNTKKDPYTKKDLIESGYPVISGGNVSRLYDSYTKNIETFVNFENFSKCNKLKQNDIFINLEDFSDMALGKCVFYLGTEEVGVSGHCAILRLKEEFKDIINLKYIALQINYNKDFRRTILEFATGTNTKRIKAESLKHLELFIVVPEIQKKVVDYFQRLKDSLGTLEELKKEFKIIFKQKDYYQDILFNFRKEENGI